jgi:hypothetical protein
MKEMWFEWLQLSTPDLVVVALNPSPFPSPTGWVGECLPEYPPRYNPCINVKISDSDTIGLDSTTNTVDVMPTAVVGDVLSDRYRLDEEIGRHQVELRHPDRKSDLARSP